MKKIISFFLFLFLSTSYISAKNNIDESLYTSLEKYEEHVKNKIKNINSEKLEKSIVYTTNKMNSLYSMRDITIYTFFKNTFELELKKRQENIVNINQEDMETKIKMTIWGKELIVEIENNETAKDFLNLLPLTIDLKDYVNTEKVFDIPRKLKVDNSISWYDPEIWDIAYYSPWWNIAIFYKDFSYSNWLIPIWKIISWIENLNVSWDIKNVKFELIEDKILNIND